MTKELFYKIAFFAVFGLLAIHYNAFSQSKKLTPTDAASQNSSLFARSLQNLQWLPTGDILSWVAGQSLITKNIQTGSIDTILKLDKLNTVLTTLSLKSLNKFPSVDWISNHTLTLTRENKVVVYDLVSNTASIVNTIPEKSENTDVETTGQVIAFTRENNLFIHAGGVETAVSSDPEKDRVYGANNVHRNEFGIDKGTFWSPKGNCLAFYRMDQTMIPDYPLVDITTRIATSAPTKYPMAGEKSHEVTLGVYNRSNNSTVYMKTGLPAEQYLTSITWDPTEKYIYIGVLNRDQNHLKMNKYDAVSGEFLKTLFEEKSDRYVEPENALYFIPSKPNEFLWLSERDGFNHLYHYNTEGKLIKQVTSGEWMITRLDGFTPDGNEVFFTSTKESPLEKNLYIIQLSGKNLRKLSTEKGTHAIKISQSGRYIVDQYSNTSVALKVMVTDVQNQKQTLLHEVINPLEGYSLGETTIFTLKNAEGTDLFCRMIKPVDFDPSKKYPAIVYVYGGPHAQLVTNSWLSGAGFYLNYLAQQGYVVFTLDNRGSANRGFAFESAIHRQCGTLETEDQMCGIRFLKQQPFVDSTRIGIDGWSYGGFMTINMLLEHPGVFKAATAGGPVCDWKYYEIMYGERYMDTPETNPEGYKKASIIEKSGNLQDNLLIIHCTSDPVVVWQNSLSFVQACIEKGILLDYFVYPGHDHNVGGPDRTHLIMKIEDYFKKNL